MLLLDLVYMRPLHPSHRDLHEEGLGWSERCDVKRERRDDDFFHGVCVLADTECQDCRCRAVGGLSQCIGAWYMQECGEELVSF
jgi:hypothetical protein